MTRLRFFALLAVATSALVLLVAQPAPAGQEEDDDPEPLDPDLALVEQTTWVRPDGDLLLRLDPAGLPDGTTLEVTVHERVIGRDAFTDGLTGGPLGTVLSRRCATLLTDGVTPLDPCRIPVDRAELDDAGALTLVLPLRSTTAGPADRILLDDEGVYPVQVSVSTPDGVEQDPLVTHVLRPPVEPDDLRPLAVSLIVPLQAPVALQPDGTRELAGGARRDLEARLQALARHDTPLTIVPTPETLDALAAVDPGGAGMLLGATTTGRELVATPYVDLDLAAWWNDGLRSELIDQLDAGATHIDTLTGSTPGRATWPLARPTMDPESLGQLPSIGVEQVVVPEESFDPLPETTFPYALDQPFAVPTDDGTTIPAVMDDASLRDHVDATDDPRLDAHHMLADLAVLYFQRPGIERGVATSLPADRRLDPAFLDVLLDGLSGAEVLRPVTADQLFELASPAREGGIDDRAGEVLVRPYRWETPEDLGSYPAELRAARDQLSLYRSLIGDRDDVAGTPVGDLLLVSGARDLRPSERRAYLHAAVTSVERVADGIEAPEHAAVTLAAREGLIPVRIRNDLDHPVEVAVELRSDKLEFPEERVITTTLPPGETKLEVGVRTRASGAFPVDIVVTAPDGSLVLSETRFTLRSTAVPGIGIVLSLVAALVLAVWWARHWRTARRARRLVDTSGETAPADLGHRDEAARHRDQVVDDITRV